MSRQVPRLIDHTPSDDEKVAATIDELQQGVRRLGAFRNHQKVTGATKRLLSAEAADATEAAARAAAIPFRQELALQGPMTVSSPRVAKTLQQQLVTSVAGQLERVRPSYEAMGMAVPGVAETEAAVRAGFQPIVDRASAVGRPTIMQPAGGAVPTISRHIGPIQGGETQRGVNVVNGIHEGFERAVKPRDASLQGSHMGPEVLLKEHNALAALHGPGAEGTRGVMQKLREGSGESYLHEGVLEHLYGPGAASFSTFGQGGKIPKSIRRDATRRWNGAVQYLGTGGADEYAKTASPRVELYTRVKEAEDKEEGGRGKYLATAAAGAGLTGAGFHAALNGHKLLGLGAIGLGTGAGTYGGLMATLPSSTRRQIEREWHDPRLYSNLRGMASLESREERRGAHRQLTRNKDYSVLGAMHEGFTRGGGEKVGGEALEGGKADGHRPSDFAAAALAKGTRHEREHTRDDAVAREIAMDHLTEDPRYYDKADLIENPRLTPLLLRLAKAEERRGEKHASDLSKATGLRRVGELLTGSRAKKLKGAMDSADRVGELLASSRATGAADVNDPARDRAVGFLLDHGHSLGAAHEKELSDVSDTRWRAGAATAGTALLARGAVALHAAHKKKKSPEAGEKTAVSTEWVDRLVRRGAAKTPERLVDFSDRVDAIAARAYRASNGLGTKEVRPGVFVDAPLASPDTPAMRELARRRYDGANHAADLALDLYSKTAFETSMYSGPLSYGPFKQESDLPPFRAPVLARQADPRRAQTELGAAVTHEKVGRLKSAAPLSPTARLSSAQQVGKTPNMDTGGPSIQQIAKPVGFGIKLPGAGKGTTTI